MAAPARAEVRPSADDVQRVVTAAFDPAFYRAINTDLPSDMSPLWHYCRQGWREGRDPAPWFSASGYRAANPDVARRIDGLFHYLTKGRHEGREVVPSAHARAYYQQIGWAPETWSFAAFGVGPAPVSRHKAGAAPVPLAGLSRAESDAAVTREFDAAFYLAANPDVASSGMDPLAHFLATGWLEGRDPNAGFSVEDYLDANPDVAAAGLNPFAHYVIAGRAEGRAARHDLGFQFDVIARLRPVEERIAAAIAASAVQATAPAAVLAAALAGLRPDLHITFSHDNYVENAGGLQLCLRRESQQIVELGRDHLHLYPASPWPTVRATAEAGPLGVLLNGRPLGVFDPVTVREVMSGIASGGQRSFAIHSLLGHAADPTADILDAAGMGEGFIWLHDFASLCAGFHLQRNDTVDCGAPPADSAACGVCVYGPFRARHTDAHRRLFARLALTVVAPSETTLDFWRGRTDLPAAATVVLPHARLVSQGRAPSAPKDRPLRVAFLGMPSSLKGWPVFRDLARALADDPRYAFLHLGGRPDPAAPAEFHPVTATAEQPQAMQDAIEALEVDVALIWPLCRETFSFIAYEAAAGGAMVVTGPDSGNVAAFAAGRGRGRVLADEAALLSAFQSGDILALGRSRRIPRRYGLTFSGMTADLIRTAP